MAFPSSGQAVWVMDAVTGEQWWSAPHHAVDDVCDAIAAALEGLGSGMDLATHAPGHAVLASIARPHTKASPTAAHPAGLLGPRRTEPPSAWMIRGSGSHPGLGASRGL